jgi:hypothetical protein
MPVPTSTVQDSQAAIAAIIAFTACLCVAYWRTMLRAILVILVALVIVGLIVGYEGLTSLMASHHG